MTLTNRLIQNCLCGNVDNFVPETIHNISVLVCSTCGVMHQNLEMTTEEYFNFYANEYHTKFQSNRGTQTYQERYHHDRVISQLRLDAYRPYLQSSSKVLDIGSSNNAFVDWMNESNYQTWGVEIGSEGEKHHSTTYTKDLMDVHFPPGTFDLVTLHDVLEHFIDPLPYIKELHKIITQNGTLVIDLPNFFEDSGKHHWKHIEHLWFLSRPQLESILDQNGFVVNKVTQPIPSKLVFYVKKKPEPQRKKLLFMPGMGDIYWCLTKMEAFIKENNLGVPESYIWDLDQKKIGAQQRSENFLNRFSFMEYKGTLDTRVDPVFYEFYAHKNAVGAAGKIKHPGAEAKWYVENYRGFDYVFNMNGILEIGESMVEGYGLEKYKTSWQPTMFTPLDENDLECKYKEKYGKYIFGYFTGTGAYDQVFNKTMTPDLICKVAERLHEITGAVLVLTGTTWDAQSSSRIQKCDTKGIVFSEVNQTNTSQLFALMKGSIGVFGWPAGNTIVATSMFHKPSVIMWSNKVWHEGFAPQCIDPAVVNKTHFPLYIEDYAPNYEKAVPVIVSALLKAMGIDEPKAAPIVEVVPEVVLPIPEPQLISTPVKQIARPESTGLCPPKLPTEQVKARSVRPAAWRKP